MKRHLKHRTVKKREMADTGYHEHYISNKNVGKTVAVHKSGHHRKKRCKK